LVGQGAGPEPAGADGPPAETIEKVRAALAARVALALALQKTYSAWNSLAQYDASTSVATGVTGVVDAVNTLGKVWNLAPIPSAAGKIVSAGAGSLAAGRQVHKLKEASRQLRTALEAYKTALTKGRSPTVSLLRDRVDEDYALKIALWRRGYLSARPLIASFGQSAQLEIQSQGSPFAASNEALCIAVRDYLQVRRGHDLQAIEDEYDAQSDLIDALIKAHLDFEKGGGLDLGKLKDIADRLTSIAVSIRKGA
jgi:hypothetical protein